VRTIWGAEAGKVGMAGVGEKDAFNHEDLKPMQARKARSKEDAGTEAPLSARPPDSAQSRAAAAGG